MSVRKSVVEANRLSIEHEQIVFSEGLYHHFFIQEVNRRKEAAVQLFRRQFVHVVEHRDLVLCRPEYFLIRNDRFGTGCTLTGGFDYCLGGLLEAWFIIRELWKERKGYLMGGYLVGASGSLLSRRHMAILWSPDLQQFVKLNDLEGKLTNSPH